MKIILENLTITKVYVYRPLSGTSYAGYINSTGSLVADENSVTYFYDCSNINFIKVISEDSKTSVTNARFIDANNNMIGSVVNYTANAETEFEVPSGAVEFQVTDKFGVNSNKVSAQGKKIPG